MSLSSSQFLIPRESLENYNTAFENIIKSLDAETLFQDVIGLEAHKRNLMRSIKSVDPVHYVIIGDPGAGKSLLLKSIEKAFPDVSLWIDSTTSSGIGMIMRIFEKGPKLRFILCDELEKFNKNDREVLLNVLEKGILKRDLKDESYLLKDLHVWFFATCNDIKAMQKTDKPLLDRCEIMNVPRLEYDQFLFVVGKRLQKEAGIDDDEIARYIAKRTFHEFGREPNMRKAMRISRMSNACAVDTNRTLDKDIVDETLLDMKATTLIKME